MKQSSTAPSSIVSYLAAGVFVALIFSGVSYVAGSWLGLFVGQILTFSFSMAMLSHVYGRISFPTVLNLFFFLYAAAPGWDTYLFNGSRYDLSLTSSFVFANNLFMASYAVLATVFRNMQPATAVPAADNKSANIYLLLLCLSFAVYIISIQSAYGTLSPQINRLDIFLKKGTFLQITKLILPLYLAVTIVTFAKKRGRLLGSILIGVIFLSYAYIEVMIFGDRRLFAALLIVICIFLYEQRRFGFRELLIGVFIAALLIALGDSRNREDISLFSQLTNIVKFLNFSKYEFGYAGIIAQDLARSEEFFEFSPSLLDVPLQLVPSPLTSALAIDRPLAPSQLYSLNYHPDIFFGGGAFGYNVVIESVQNASFLGPVILAALFVYITRAVYKPGSQGFQFSIKYGLLFATLFSARLDAISVIKQAIVVIVALAIVQVLTGLSQPVAPSNKARRQLKAGK